ncbi:MAG: hypothetical protein R3C53_10705 [Pirellulaceae bacterium]
MATRRRLRRTRRTSFFSTLILEGAAFLGIVALAQPSWSGLLIEAVSSTLHSPPAVQAPAAHEPAPLPLEPAATPAQQAGPTRHYAQQSPPTYSFMTYH